MALYVMLGEHSADLCPTSNAKSRKLAEDLGANLPSLASKYNIKPLGIYVVGLTHKMVALVEAPNAEAVRAFGMEGNLVQWNSIEIHPAWTMEEALKETAALRPVDW